MALISLFIFKPQVSAECCFLCCKSTNGSIMSKVTLGGYPIQEAQDYPPGFQYWLVALVHAGWKDLVENFARLASWMVCCAGRLSAEQWGSVSLTRSKPSYNT